MNIYSKDYVGCTGIHSVFEYVDDASNVISDRITNEAKNSSNYTEKRYFDSINYTAERAITNVNISKAYTDDAKAELYTALYANVGQIYTDYTNELIASNLETSNYVQNTSNAISERISGLHNVSLQTIGNIANVSNLETSNYVLSTSNDISTRISGLHNISLATIGNIANVSNLETSNYVLSTSNDISTRISGLHNISLATIGNIANVSNLETSNYVFNTSNDISTRISGLHNISLQTIGNIANVSNLETSNYIQNTSNDISNFFNNKWISSNNIQQMNTVIQEIELNSDDATANSFLGQEQFNNVPTETKTALSGLSLADFLPFYKENQTNLSFIWDKEIIENRTCNILYTYSNIGIMTSNPDLRYSLDVNGDVNVSGDLYVNNVNLTDKIITQANYVDFNVENFYTADKMKIRTEGKTIRIVDNNPDSALWGTTHNVVQTANLLYMLDKNDINGADAGSNEVYINGTLVASVNSNTAIEIDKNTTINLIEDATIAGTFLHEIRYKNECVGLNGNVYITKDVLFDCEIEIPPNGINIGGWDFKKGTSLRNIKDRFEILEMEKNKQNSIFKYNTFMDYANPHGVKEAGIKGDFFVSGDIHTDNDMIVFGPIYKYIGENIQDKIEAYLDAYIEPIFGDAEEDGIIGSYQPAFTQAIKDVIKGQLDSITNNDLSRCAYFPHDDKKKLSNLVKIKSGSCIYREPISKTTKIGNTLTGTPLELFLAKTEKSYEIDFNFDTDCFEVVSDTSKTASIIKQKTLSSITTGFWENLASIFTPENTTTETVGNVGKLRIKNNGINADKIKLDGTTDILHSETTTNYLKFRYDTGQFEKNATTYKFQLKDGGINADKLNLSLNDVLYNNANNLNLRYNTAHFQKNGANQLELKNPVSKPLNNITTPLVYNASTDTLSLNIGTGLTTSGNDLVVSKPLNTISMPLAYNALTDTLSISLSVATAIVPGSPVSILTYVPLTGVFTFTPKNALNPVTEVPAVNALAAAVAGPLILAATEPIWKVVIAIGAAVGIQAAATGWDAFLELFSGGEPGFDTGKVSIFSPLRHSSGGINLTYNLFHFEDKGVGDFFHVGLGLTLHPAFADLIDWKLTTDNSNPLGPTFYYEGDQKVFADRLKLSSDFKVNELKELELNDNKIGSICTSSNLDTSNYVLNTSNVISTRITGLSNIVNASNLDTSNYVLNTSNTISTRITGLSNIVNASNLDTSNYVLNTSNAISTRINSLSLGSSLWTNNTTNLQYGDVRVYSDKITIGNNTTYGITPRVYPPTALAGTAFNDNTTTKELLVETYGNGVYNISWSSDYGSWRPSHFFDGVNAGGGGGHSADNTYNATLGTYNTSVDNKIVQGYLGEWVKLQLPNAIYLSYIKIYQKSGIVSKSPKNYKVYGSTDGSNWTELLSETNASYVSGVHTSQTTNIQTVSSYNYYALCINSIIGGDAGSTLLNFDELQFYGNETRDIVASPLITDLVLNASNLDTSNYVLNTSNAISTRISGLNIISLETIGTITQSSNTNTSNYVLSTSNAISTRINSLAFNNVSIETIGTITQSSNTNTSNYVLNTSNILSTRINSLSLGSSLWTNNTTNLQYGNVRVYSDKITIGNNTTYGITPRVYPPTALAGTAFNDNTTTKELLGGSYGNGIYNISWSSDYGSWRPSHFFGGVNAGGGGGHSVDGTYNATSGTYNTSVDNKIVPGYLGEWVKLQLPNAIYLSYIKIYQKSGVVSKSPKNYKVYGSNDGTNNWTELLSETNASYVSGIHTSQTTNIQTISSYNYYALCINSIIGGDAGSTLLNFDELQFYGNETRDIVASPLITDLVLNASNLDTSNYILNTSNNLQTQINGKQAPLTAGQNITIVDNVISASVGGGTSQWTTSGTSVYYNGGNVGIGTVSPDQKLHLFSDNTSINMFMKLTANVAREVGIILERPAGTTWAITNKGSGFTTSVNNLSFTNGATNVLELTPSGNVGIGTASPDHKLHLFSDNTSINMHMKLTANVAREVGIILERPAGTTWVIENKGTGYGTSQNNLAFTNSTTSVLELTPSGNVGIGVAPAYKLDVAGDINFTGTLRQNGNDVLSTVPRQGTYSFTILNRETKYLIFNLSPYVALFANLSVGFIMYSMTSSGDSWSCASGIMFLNSSKQIVRFQQFFSNNMTTGQYDGNFTITNDTDSSHTFTLTLTSLQ